MKLKNPNSSPTGGFVFYFEHPKTGEDVRVPNSPKVANGLSQLKNWVVQALLNNAMEIPPDLPLIIEHQICLRQPDPLKTCYSGGIGDDVHHKVMKPFLKAVASTATKAGLKSVASVAKKVSSCTTCGGTKVYRPGANNLGRAGTVNKFAGNADYKY